MKKVLVACGNGIATSTVVATKIREYAEEQGVDISTSQTKLLEVPSKASDFDLIVTTGEYKNELGVPIINGLSLITGMGEEETLEEIVNKLE